jgi:hypothetical protein
LFRFRVSCRVIVGLAVYLVTWDSFSRALVVRVLFLKGLIATEVSVWLKAIVAGFVKLAVDIVDILLRKVG